MKKKLSKIIALLLTVASLISMLTVFAWADENEEEGPEEEEIVVDFDVNEDWLYYRTYEDGWGPGNGVSSDSKGELLDNVTKSGHKVDIDYEVAANGDYNYFTRFEYNDPKNAVSSIAPYYTFNFGSRVKLTDGFTVIGMSIKADDACEMGTIMYAILGSKTREDLLIIQDSKLYAFSVTPSNYICSLADGDWCDVDIVMDWNDRSAFNARVFINGVAKIAATLPYGNDTGDSGVQTLYLGMSSTTDEKKDGMSYCLDNLRIYQDATLPFTDLSQYGYGVFVETNAEKTVPIYKNADDKTVEQILAESLAMKLGVPSALARNEKIDISKYFIPAVVDGEIMVALDLVIDYMGYPKYIHADGSSYDITIGAGETAYVTVGLNTATVNGKLVNLAVAPGVVKNADGENVIVVSMNDIPNIFPKWNVTYDDMGLIIVYEKIEKEGQDTANLISRDTNLDALLSIMKKFVFDTAIKSDKDEAYTATGETVYNAVNTNTNGFKHPYIFADQNTFNSLSAIYKDATATSPVKAYIDGIVAKADAYYEDVVLDLSATGEITFKPGKTPVNEYQDGVYPNYALNPDDTTIADSDDGYNPDTKALYELEKITANLVNLAFAYQMTGDSKYVYLAYAVSVTLGEWVHWAPGYFINCANAASDFAVSYDWLYNAYVTLLGEESVQTLATILYNQAIVHAYNSVTGEFCKFPRTAGYGDSWNTRTDSWNAICSSGLIIASMAIMEFTGADALNCSEKVSYVVGNCMINLADYGLDQYAPDGSYIESVTYWANGTNAFMKLIMAFESAAGDDFGFKDTWGINDTFYFACYIENSDGDAWNYHEDGIGSIVDGDVLTVDTQMFNFAAQLFGDADLAAIRQSQITKGKEATIFDILFYPANGVAEAPELKLDYYMEGIDAFISRDSWENGALYVGIMGGLNDYSPYGAEAGSEKFGQIDSGNFIYQSNGINWITDLGSDYFSGVNYFGSERYRYYRNCGEGNNVVVLTSAAGAVPYGQVEAGAGDMYETYIDPNGKGSYAIINNSNVYGTYSQAAYRGMLITNDKKTVVIQDEIALSGAGDLAWIAHTEATVLAAEGKVAYLTSTDAEGNTYYLRATLVTSSSSLAFSTLKFDEKILRNRNDVNADTRSLKGISRLVIEAKNALTVQFAVVFEQLEYYGADLEVGYEWIDLNNWKNEAFVDAEEEDTVARRGIAVKSDISTKTTTASVYMDDGIAFTDSLEEFFILLADVKYVLKAFYIKDEDSFSASEEALLESYEEYLDYESRYNTFAGLVNGTNKEVLNYVDVLAGF
jgi:hypothetical protein